MATPHVSGAMALLWSAIPSLRHQISESRDAMNNAAHFISSNQCGDAGPPNNVYGWGRLDIFAAVGGTPSPTPTSTPTATPTATGTPSPTPSCSPAPTPCDSFWQERTPVPYNAAGMFAVSDGTHVYVGGGGDVTNNIFHGDLLQYDPRNDSWMPLASSPDVHGLSQAVYFDGKIYSIGGWVSASATSDLTRVYDIETNTWSTREQMPAALGSMATALWNEVIYVAGGYEAGFGAVDTLYAYDIGSDTWKTLAQMPQAMNYAAFGVINGKLYIAGGHQQRGLFEHPVRLQHRHKHVDDRSEPAAVYESIWLHRSEREALFVWRPTSVTNNDKHYSDLRSVRRHLEQWTADARRPRVFIRDSGRG
jgi:Kelch motif/Subtilase family